MLSNDTYEPSPYREDFIKEGIYRKERVIYKPRFYPDQVIHWAIYLQLYPILFKGLYSHTAGSIQGRGVHYGKRFVQHWVRTDHKNTKYYLKMDIRKFYPSISIPLLEEKLGRKIKDEKLLALVSKILALHDSLPIGVLLSQLFAIFFLQDLDHYIKQELKATYYMRYMDDMVVFGRNKKQLHRMRVNIEAFLIERQLGLKDNYQVYLFDKQPLDFMGFRFYRHKTVLRKSIMYRVTRSARRAGAKAQPTARDASSVISYMGWLRHTDTKFVFDRHIRPYVSVSKLKNIIRMESVKNANNQSRVNS